MADFFVLLFGNPIFPNPLSDPPVALLVPIVQRLVTPGIVGCDEKLKPDFIHSQRILDGGGQNRRSPTEYIDIGIDGVRRHVEYQAAIALILHKLMVELLDNDQLA